MKLVDYYAGELNNRKRDDRIQSALGRVSRMSDPECGLKLAVQLKYGVVELAFYIVVVETIVIVVRPIFEKTPG